MVTWPRYSSQLPRMVASMLPWPWAVTDDGTDSFQTVTRLDYHIDNQQLWSIGPGVHQSPRILSPRGPEFPQGICSRDEPCELAWRRRVTRASRDRFFEGAASRSA